MKRYDCYYTNDFGNDYPAFSKETVDGDWVSIEDAQAEVSQLRGNLSLAEEGLANYAQEVEGLKATLRRIEQERLTWAMSCECYCPACTTFDKLLRRAEPQTEPPNG